MLSNTRAIYAVSILVWLLCQTCFSYARSNSPESFIQFREDVELSLIGNPAISMNAAGENLPINDVFTPFDNTINTAYSKINSSPNWLRIVISNSSNSVKHHIIRFGQIPTELHLYYRDVSGNWVHKTTGALVKSTDDLNVTFHGCRVELNPGIDTLYLFNADTWHKFPYYFIEFINPDDLKAAESEFNNSSSQLTYALFAFIMLLSFQLIYVVIQASYHKKVEYREYIFYMITILIYFMIRYELCFNVNVITFNQPFLRRLLNDLMLFLPFAFYLRFSRNFMEMGANYPSMNKKIKIVEMIIFILAIMFIGMFFSEWIKYEGIFSQVVIISLSLYSLRLIWFFFRQRNKQMWFILAGSLAATTGHFLGMMSSWFDFMREIIQIQPIYYTMAGLSFEIFFFNTGLGYKAKSEQEEKLNAQEKLIQQLSANRRMQEKMESMRNKIASDLHDDVGSTLSSIGLYSEVGIDQIEKNTPYVKGILEKIAVSSQRMMTAMNDIVWAIHSRHDDGKGLVERIRAFANERLVPTGMTFNLEIGKNAEKLKFSMEARRNILLIFKEAINNAAKYSGSDSIECSISISNGSLVCRITDFGKGFNGSVKQSGNGLTTMRNRAEEMHGSLEIIPAAEGGTSILVDLPLPEIVLNGNYD